MWLFLHYQDPNEASPRQGLMPITQQQKTSGPVQTVWNTYIWSDFLRYDRKSSRMAFCSCWSCNKKYNHLKHIPDIHYKYILPQCDVYGNTLPILWDWSMMAHRLPDTDGCIWWQHHEHLLLFLLLLRVIRHNLFEELADLYTHNLLVASGSNINIVVL